MGADVYRAGGVEMVGIYFSGTGNTKYCVERFLACCDGEQEAVSIEDSWAVEAIRENEVIVFGYPVYFSNMPKIVRDFGRTSGLFLWQKNISDSNYGVVQWRRNGVFGKAVQKIWSGYCGESSFENAGLYRG